MMWRRSSSPSRFASIRSGRLKELPQENGSTRKMEMIPGRRREGGGGEHDQFYVLSGIAGSFVCAPSPLVLPSVHR